jgi:SAM-dependent methyltransferase
MHRRLQGEWMDEPDLDQQLHREALDALGRINAASGSAAALWPTIREAATKQTDRPLRVLDIACGGGDVTLGLWQRARAANQPIELVGCDISPTAIDYARQAAERRRARVEFIQCDAIHEDWPGSFDVSVTSLFLHHLEAGEVVTLLNRMGTYSRVVIADDLLRSTWGYLLAWGGTRVLTRNPVVHVDGPRSVENAFTMAELRQLAEHAGLSGFRLRRHWPGRMQLVWSRS